MKHARYGLALLIARTRPSWPALRLSPAPGNCDEAVHEQSFSMVEYQSRWHHIGSPGPLS
jgi:hypothetical protein